MKNTSKKILSYLLLCILSFVTLLSPVTTVAAEDGDGTVAPAEKFVYNGKSVNFIKEDGSGFGMWTPQEGTIASLNGDQVDITIYPKRTNVYVSMAWGSITDTSFTQIINLEEGALHISVPSSYCGYAHPIAALKADGVTTTTDQYYLAIPSVYELSKITYSGDDANFYKEDGTSVFGMLSFQEGSKYVVDGDQVKIYVVPSNLTVYDGIHWGFITDENLTKDVKRLPDGCWEIAVSTEDCGYGLPVAPVKTDEKGGGTTTAQYYLCIPALEKLDKIADYSKVEKAITNVPKDMSAYTDESVKAVKNALAVTEETSFKYYGESEQASVDAAAKAINEAVSKLTKKASEGSKSEENKSTDASAIKTGTIISKGNIGYKVTSKGEVTLTSNTDKKAKKVTIPATVSSNGQTFKVTEIANKAFANNKKLTQVVIGKNITKIGKQAFKGDKKLKKITFKGNLVKSVGKKAFNGINKKATFKAPKKVLKKYKKLIKKAGAPKTAKYKK